MDRSGAIGAGSGEDVDDSAIKYGTNDIGRDADGEDDEQAEKKRTEFPHLGPYIAEYASE